MFKQSLLVVPLLLLGVFGTVRPAHAQFAVIDVASLAQSIQQVIQLAEQLQTMSEQLQTARDDLEQARESYRSMTGGRGMENLLSNTARNYLPSDWNEVAAALTNANNAFQALSDDAQQLMDANAVLTPQQIQGLWAEAQQTLQAQRRSTALLQSLLREGLSATSARFSSIGQLISAIGSAQDMKAIADLQARAIAEDVMLRNEATKLSLLRENVLAEEAAQKLKRRERAIADIGSLRDLPPMGL